MSPTTAPSAAGRRRRWWALAAACAALAVVVSAALLLSPEAEQEVCGCTEGEFYSGLVEPDEVFVGVWLRADGEERPLLVVTGDHAEIDGEAIDGGASPRHESIYWAIDRELSDVADTVQPATAGAGEGTTAPTHAESVSPTSTTVVVRALWHDEEIVVPVDGSNVSDWPIGLRQLYEDLRDEVTHADA